MKVLIVDDEAHFRNTLKNYLKNYPEMELLGEAEGVSSAFELINEANPDLIFLDVEMGDGTGFDLINLLPPNKYKIIFTTGHSKYAANAFRYSAIDYLLKPVDEVELGRAIEKAKSAGYLAEMSQKIEALVQNRDKVEKIALQGYQSVDLVRIKDIVRCESESNYTRFYLLDGRNILVSKVLKEYEDMLEPHGFFRVHRSHMVSLHYVKQFKDTETPFVVLDDGTKVEVSRRRKKELLEKLTKF